MHRVIAESRPGDRQRQPAENREWNPRKSGALEDPGGVLIGNRIMLTRRAALAPGKTREELL